MRLTTDLKKSSNFWIRNNKIPLGINPATGGIIYKKMPLISDNIIISAMPGRGKSVISRNLIWFISQVRPVLVFDWEGEDHKLAYLPNSKPENLPFTNFDMNRRMKPAPVPNALFFNYTNNKESHEKRVIPNLCNYNSDELRGLGFAPGAAMKLREILKEYSPFKSMKQLFDFIKDFPTNERDAKKKYQDADLRKKHHKENDSMPTQTKQSLLTYLYRNMEKELFSLDDSEYPDFIRLMEKGHNIFLNFSGEVDVARVEITKIYDRIIRYRKKKPKGVAPYIFIEEGDRIIPKRIDDSEEKKKSQYVQLKLIESYKRARKLILGQCFITPTLSNLNNTIIDLSFEKIFGEMAGHDLNEVKRCSGDVAHRIVGGGKSLAGEWTAPLKFNRYEGLREFLYRNEFKANLKFRPFACPQEMHREF